tara:strand:+ start:167 stop:1024 length:858 start_codon:yes stop_codon:yes gene_type:complete
VNRTILILGGTGMLGHVLVKELEKEINFNIHNIVRENKLNEKSIICDVINRGELKKIIEKINPDIIVNCIGLLKKQSNSNISKAIYLNSYLPQWLLEICDSKKIKFIHISTDCVFDGINGNYTEKSSPNANDNYGKTKALGEFNCENHLCIRTSIIGPEINSNSKGLLSWFLNSKGDIFGFDNVIWTGVTTLELSKGIKFSILNGIDGLWNFTNEIPISKYQLLMLIKDTFRIENLEIKKDKEKKINMSLKSIRKVDFSIPNYEQMIKDLFHYFDKNEMNYNYQK